MALDRFGAEVFLLLMQHGISLDRVLTFGRQHFAIDPIEIEEIPGLGEAVLGNDELNRTGERFADSFFDAIGVRTVDSLDASDYQSCSRIHDLNEPVPESWHAAYDVVFDGGTLEHVFHFPNAIANAMNLVKPGGVLVTQSPSNNLNGHGFYQFSPELFFRLFDQPNGFEILLLAFVESDWPHRVYRVEDPESIGSRVTFSGVGPLQLITIARRKEIRTPLFDLPYQSDYSASWSRSGGADPETGNSSQPQGVDSMKRRLRNLLPASWIRRYDQKRYRHRRERLSETGITEVPSLAKCFRVADLNQPHPTERDDLETPQPEQAI